MPFGPLQQHGRTPTKPRRAPDRAAPTPGAPQPRYLVAQRLVDVGRQLSCPPLRLQLHRGAAAGAWAEGRGGSGARRGRDRDGTATGAGRAAPPSPLPRWPLIKRNRPPLPLPPRGPAAPRPSWPACGSQLRLVKAGTAPGDRAPQQRPAALLPPPSLPPSLPPPPSPHPTRRRGLARGT